MLIKIRKAAKSFVFLFILFVMLASFVGWQLSDFLKAPKEKVIVSFKDTDSITQNEFEKGRNAEIKRIQATANISLDEEQLKSLDINSLVLNQLINDRMIKYFTKIYGLELSDDLIISKIKSIPAFQNNQGVFEKNIYLQALNAQGISEDQFIKQLKEDIAEQIILNLFAFNLPAPSSLTSQIAAYLNEQRNLTIASVNIKNLPTSGINVLDKEIEEFYQANKKAYMTPETRNLTYATLEVEKLAKNIQVNNEELENIYKENIDEFTIPELYSFYKFSFKDEAAATKALEEFKQAKIFDNVVTKVLNQPSGKFLNSKIPLQAIEPEFSTLLLNLQKGGISEVTKKGEEFYIIKLTEKSPKVVKSFESVKQDIANYSKMQKLQQLLVDLNKNIEDEIAAGGSLSEIAPKYKFTISKFILKSDSDKKPSFMNIPKIAEKVFNLKEGEVSEIFEIPSKSPELVLAQLDKIENSTQIDFNGAKSRVKADLIKEKQYKLAGEILNEFLKNPNYKHKNLIITENKITRAALMQPKFIKGIPVELYHRAFLIEKGKFTDITESMDGLFAAKVNSVSSDKGPSMVKIDAVAERLNTTFNNSIFEEIILALRTAQDVKVK